MSDVFIRRKNALLLSVPIQSDCLCQMKKKTHTHTHSIRIFTVQSFSNELVLFLNIEINISYELTIINYYYRHYNIVSTCVLYAGNFRAWQMFVIEQKWSKFSLIPIINARVSSIWPRRCRTNRSMLNNQNFQINKVQQRMIEETTTKQDNI